MLYLLDANVLITAKDSYYSLDTVPEYWEYWEWLEHMARQGQVKIPVEIFEEIKEGPKKVDADLLYAWIQQTHVRKALVLDEAVDVALVQEVVNKGYAPDLTDDQVEEIGRDAFLIAYAMASPGALRRHCRGFETQVAPTKPSCS